MTGAEGDDFWESDFQDIEFGVPRLRKSTAARPGRGGRWPWAVGGLAGGALVALAVVVLGQGGDTASAPTTVPASAPTTRPAPTVPATTAASTTVVMTTTAAMAEFRFAARTDDEIVLVGLGGVAERWSYPRFREVSDINLVVGEGWAAVAPADGLGWVVRRQQLPELMNGDLMLATGPVFAGSRAETLWKVDLDRNVLTLVDLEGGFLLQTVPGSTQRPVGSDGHGTVVLQADDAGFLATEAGVERVTPGRIVAIGETTVLAVQCEARLGCRNVAIRREDGHTRLVAGLLFDTVSRLGRVAPSGTVAAVHLSRGESRLAIVDLDSGEQVTSRATGGVADVVWSPDSRFVYYVGPDGEIHVVDLTAPDEDQILDIGTEPVLDLAPRLLATD